MATTTTAGWSTANGRLQDQGRSSPIWQTAPTASPSANAGFEGFDAQNVTFRWRDCRVKTSAHTLGDAAIKHETLPLDTFVRRFCQHLLPRSFTKIRHYGILANHVRKREIPKARAAIARSARHVLRYQPSPAGEPWQPACAHCVGTHLLCVALVQPDGRMIELPAVARLSLLRPRSPP